MIEKSITESVDKKTFKETNVEEGFLILTFKNEESVAQSVAKEIDSSFIQFHFCIKGGTKFVFNQGRYSLDIHEENSLLLYNPQRELPIDLQVDPNSWIVSVLISSKVKIPFNLVLSLIALTFANNSLSETKQYTASE